MADFDFDLVVIGGGPGGSTAASVARQQGLKVLVVEREQFPRFHIGESLLPMGNAIMRETGAWPKLEALGAIRKYGALFFSANGEAAKEIIFADGLVPGLEYTYQVDRAKFDQLLLENAESLGAEVRFRTRATALEPIPGGHRVVLEAEGGAAAVTTPWVLDASGRDNLLMTEQKRALDPSVFPKRFAVFTHFRGVHRPPGRAAGHTIAVRLDHGWFWLIPLTAEITSVGLVTTAEAIRRAGGQPEEVFAQAVAASPKLTELMAGTGRIMPFRTTNDYSYFRKNLGAERLLLVGDAAGFFDPIFSSGVYMSMWSARRAVELVVRARKEGRVLSAAERADYTRAMKRHAATFQKLIAAFYDNDSFAVFMSDGKRWGIERAIVSVVAGHARMSWPMWWRFRAFLAVCWLQRHGVRVAPRLRYESSILDPLRPEPAA
jgi:flavin-dependent dehydrogenase